MQRNVLLHKAKERAITYGDISGWKLPMFILFTSIACIPIPQNSVVQPQLQIQVFDKERQYISNVQIFLVTVSDPHSNVHRYMPFETDNKGFLFISEQREFEWVFPLTMHGIPFYSHHLCIYKDGYVPQSIDITPDTSQDESTQSIVITLLYKEEFHKKKRLGYEEAIDPCGQYKDK